MNQDILNIDQKVKEHFRKLKSNLDKYRKELKQLKESKKIEILSTKIKSDIVKRISWLQETIKDIEQENSLNFYLAESIPLIERYKEILRKPIKVSFMSRKKVENPEKKKIIDEYCYIAKKYVDLKIDSSKSIDKKIVCEDCKNNKNFEIVENNYVCSECGTVQDTEVHTTSYTDIDRVNMSTKYSYDRKIHFRDCIYQYQGKQNCTIDDKVYRDLEHQLEIHDILVGDKYAPKEIRFQNVTKFHIELFCKEIGYEKYENINLIHWKLTGKKPDDISHLEEKLMEDFTTLVRLYYVIYKDENNVERSSFINTQQLFYQLLLKHKHPCRKEDFSFLKTVDRLIFHDTICEDLFKILDWSYTSIY